MSNQSSDAFDVAMEVRNFQGNLLFIFYPKAGVIEFKRNRIYSQISLDDLTEKGVQALRTQKLDEPLRVLLPQEIVRRA